MKLTVFTPTYNRVETLPRLFSSLCRQTNKNFEWLIVDDGSTDGTKTLIDSYTAQESGFAIRYFYQKHGGKPRALNKAIDFAGGGMLITCDSNKFLADCAVEMILEEAKKISIGSEICGIGGYRADFAEKIWGGEMQIAHGYYTECTYLEREQYDISGDKSTAFYVDVLRNYKSPEFEGEDFVSEAAWLIPMAMDGYKIRWLPEIFVYGEYAKGGLTQTGANSKVGHEKNFLGFLYLIKMEKAARGLKKTSYMLYEAMDIAKSKGMPDKEFEERTGCTWREITQLRALRILHNAYGKVSGCAKEILGTKIVEKIKEMKRD